MAPCIRALLVVDEYQARSLLGSLIEENFPEVEIVGQATDVQSAFDLIQSSKPDLVFLDIQMRNETGFDLLLRFPAIHFDVIFTTAHHEYALKAFRFNAIDYLLKPIILTELNEAIEKVKRKEQSEQHVSIEQLIRLQQSISNPPKTPDKITVPTSNGFILLQITDILYCEAKNNYTQFHLSNNQTITSSYTLKQYHEILSNCDFFRANRSFLINLNHIKMYKRNDGGLIVMDNGTEVELSHQQKESFLQHFKSK